MSADYPFENRVFKSFQDKNPPEVFPFYSRALRSAIKASQRSTATFIDTHLTMPFDEPLDIDGYTIFDRGDGAWLRRCTNSIRLAIESGDEAFFLRLATHIKERPRSSRKIRKIPPIEWMSSKWTSLLLWLMPDPVGAAYVRKFLGYDVTEAAYTKTRQRFELVQHPNHPVEGFTVDAVPIFRKGWTTSRRSRSS